MRNIEIKLTDLERTGLVKLGEREFIKDVTHCQVCSTGKAFWAKIEEYTDWEWNEINKIQSSVGG